MWLNTHAYAAEECPNSTGSPVSQPLSALARVQGRPEQVAIALRSQQELIGYATYRRTPHRMISRSE